MIQSISVEVRDVFPVALFSRFLNISIPNPLFTLYVDDKRVLRQPNKMKTILVSKSKSQSILLRDALH